MKTLQKNLLMIVILILVMSLVACAKKEPSQETPSKDQAVKKLDAVEKAVPVEKTVPVEKAVPAEKAVPDKKAEFTYSIIDETYTEKGITIKFPQLTKASNPT